MPDTSAIVEPKPEAQPSASVQPAKPAEPVETDEGQEASNSLPDEVAGIPAVQAMLAGQPAAVSAPLAEFSKRPEAAAIIKNKDALMKAGFGLYRSLGGDLGVIFNQLHVHGDQIAQADKAGKLLEIAPPFDAVNEAISKSGTEHPILKATGVPAGPKGQPMPTPPQMSAGPSASLPAGAQRKLAAARTANQLPGSPTSGPQPGSGRILNAILKPVL